MKKILNYRYMSLRVIPFFVLLTACLTIEAQMVDISKVFSDAERQTDTMLRNLLVVKAAKADQLFPRTLEKGELKLVSSRDWTSGFFPGVLWSLYAYSGKQKWKAAAEKYTAFIEREQFNGGTHDMGFKVYCSFGAGYRLTKDARYKAVIIQAAKTLATRFSKVTGTIRSWDNRTEWGYPVIIDNMMNLELLFAATRLTGDSAYYRIAVAHANTTMKNHFRKDYSSYHVVDYDTTTGQVIKKTTHQGYATESAWARGQGWGLYGYTMCYRETGDKRYLQQADSIAAFILHHPNTPADGIPYWDYNAPDIPNAPRDASAAAIMASAFYELSGYSGQAKPYRAAADKILQSLTNKYRSPVGKNKGFILLHSTGHKPANSEVDVPINYADYYYLEALMRSKKTKGKE